jgi:hypothetical protein
MLTITPPIQFLLLLWGHHRQHLKTIKIVLQSHMYCQKLYLFVLALGREANL